MKTIQFKSLQSQQQVFIALRWFTIISVMAPLVVVLSNIPQRLGAIKGIEKRIQGAEKVKQLFKVQLLELEGHTDAAVSEWSHFLSTYDQERMNMQDSNLTGFTDFYRGTLSRLSADRLPSMSGFVDLYRLISDRSGLGVDSSLERTYLSEALVIHFPKLIRDWKEGDPVAALISDLKRAKNIARIPGPGLSSMDRLDSADGFNRFKNQHSDFLEALKNSLVKARKQELMSLFLHFIFGGVLVPGLIFVLMRLGQKKLMQGYESIIKISADLKARVDLAMSSAKMGVWDWDVVRNHLEWDDSLYRLYKMDSKNFIGAYDAWKHSLHPDDQERSAQELKVAMDTGSKFDTQFRIIHPDGGIAHIRAVGLVTRDETGKVVRVTGLNWDITQSVLDQVEIETSRGKQIAATKMATLGEMAGGIAHEINNPLAVISGKAALLKKNIASARQDAKPLDLDKAFESLEKIESFASRIAKIVKGLRSFSRDSSQDPMSEVSIQTVIEDSLSLCTERFKSHNVALNVTVPEAPIWVKGRSSQLSQVILNLLSNAYDACQGTPFPAVNVSVGTDSQGVWVRVQDNGPGVPIELEEKIMQPFFTTKELGKGTGLGLSISVGIVKDHQGQLVINRTFGASCFEFRLPMIIAKIEPGQAA